MTALLDEYTLLDEFAGCGGSSQGATSVHGVELIMAANHWDRAVESHAANFPNADHYHGDVRSIDMAKFPRADIAWFSPSCPPFSGARGERRDFDRSTQGVLWEDEGDAELKKEADRRGRTLMYEVIRYLEAMNLRGRPVLSGVVENVPEARKWDSWHHWISRLKGEGYKVRVIALNSMHAQPRRTHRAPQSRDRLYVAFWHVSIGRDPDWDKWLRPVAYCPTCDAKVQAIQVFKKTGADMGRYGVKNGQYVYRCPSITCRNQVVEPLYRPAYDIVDWTNLGTRIGDRDRPMSPKSINRIIAGLRKFGIPITVEMYGNTFERRPGVRTWPVTSTVTTQTTTGTKGIAIPPMIVPVGGTWNDDATSVLDPLRTRTTRDTDGLAVPPFITVHRSGGETRTAPIGGTFPTLTAGGNHMGVATPPFLTVFRDGAERRVRGLDEPTATMVAGAAGHGLAVPDAEFAAFIMRHFGSPGDGGEHCTPVTDPLRTLTAKGHQSLVSVDWQQALVPYYNTGVAHPLDDPVGTITTKDRFGLATGIDVMDILDINDVRFRMLTPLEIAAAMAFAANYIVLGTQAERIRQYGNAVTPPCAEVIVSALVECMRGYDLAV